MDGPRSPRQAGLHHGGGHIPIGYEYEDGHLVINPYEAEQVRKIYEWYLAGDSLKTITDKLQEVGYTNSTAATTHGPASETSSAMRPTPDGCILEMS